MDAFIKETIKMANQKERGHIIGVTVNLTMENGEKEKGMVLGHGKEQMEIPMKANGEMVNPMVQGLLRPTETPMRGNSNNLLKMDLEWRSLLMEICIEVIISMVCLQEKAHITGPIKVTSKEIS